MRRKGRIVKRGKRSWAVVLYLGRDPQTAKEKRKWYTFPSQHDAEQFLHQCLAFGPGVAPPNTRLRLGEYLERWLMDYAAGAVAPTTFAGYRDIIRVHLAPAQKPIAFGLTPLPRLTPQAIQSYISSKLEAGLSTTTVRHHFALLHEALHYAVRWALLARNPAEMVDPPRERRPDLRVFDEEQVRLFLAEAKRSSRYYGLYLTATLTGMRAGELLGLRWQDVDLTIGTVSIRQTFYRLGGSKKENRRTQMLFKEPKSAKSRRAISLPPVVVTELRALRETVREGRRLLGPSYHDYDLVFAQPNGKPLHLNDVRRGDFRKILKQAGLPRIRFHDLRHCHATMLLRQGVNPKVVQERLGHSTPAFTLAVYSHVLPGMQEEAARTLAERLLGKAAEKAAQEVD
jgi:integrase